MRTRRICVGVPVWHGADYVAEALESVLRQRGVGLTIVVSVDGADEVSVKACRPFAADARVTVLVQPRRLGWVGNSSAALAAAVSDGADYACLLPHDDVLEDDYLADLLAAMEANAGAGVVYSDIQSFGARDTEIRQPTVIGSPFERQMALMRGHFAAVSYRGLMRTSALRSILPMAGNPYQDFAADTVWMARQALVGDLVRVPRALYRKRYHANNTHTQWVAWPYDFRMSAWIRHCLDMLAEALKSTSKPLERRMLYKAACRRLMQRGVWGPYRTDLLALKRPARARMRSRFDLEAASRADIGVCPETRLWAVLRRARSAPRRLWRRTVAGRSEQSAAPPCGSDASSS